jgi:hypothetical protein
MEGSCNYIDKQCHRQPTVVLQFEDWVGGGLTTAYHKKPACYKVLHRTLDMDGFFEAHDKVWWRALVNMVMNLWVT